jgi:hypothetical protein
LPRYWWCAQKNCTNGKCCVFIPLTLGAVHKDVTRQGVGGKGGKPSVMKWDEGGQGVFKNVTSHNRH